MQQGVEILHQPAKCFGVAALIGMVFKGRFAKHAGEIRAVHTLKRFPSISKQFFGFPNSDFYFGRRSVDAVAVDEIPDILPTDIILICRRIIVNNRVLDQMLVKGVRCGHAGHERCVRVQTAQAFQEKGVQLKQYGLVGTRIGLECRELKYSGYIRKMLIKFQFAFFGFKIVFQFIPRFALQGMEYLFRYSGYAPLPTVAETQIMVSALVKNVDEVGLVLRSYIGFASGASKTAIKTGDDALDLGVQKFEEEAVQITRIDLQSLPGQGFFQTVIVVIAIASGVVDIF